MASRDMATMHVRELIEEIRDMVKKMKPEELLKSLIFGVFVNRLEQEADRADRFETIIRDVLYGDPDGIEGHRFPNGLIGCKDPKPDMEKIIDKLCSAKVTEL